MRHVILALALLVGCAPVGSDDLPLSDTGSEGSSGPEGSSSHGDESSDDGMTSTSGPEGSTGGAGDESSTGESLPPYPEYHVSECFQDTHVTQETFSNTSCTSYCETLMVEDLPEECQEVPAYECAYSHINYEFAQADPGSCGVGEKDTELCGADGTDVETTDCIRDTPGGVTPTTWSCRYPVCVDVATQPPPHEQCDKVIQYKMTTWHCLCEQNPDNPCST